MRKRLDNEQDLSMPIEQDDIFVRFWDRRYGRVSTVTFCLVMSSLVLLVVVSCQNKVDKSEFFGSAEMLLRESVPTLTDGERAVVMREIAFCVMEKSPGHALPRKVEALKRDKTFMYPILERCLRGYVAAVPDLESQRARNVSLGALAPFQVIGDN